MSEHTKGPWKTGGTVLTEDIPISDSEGNAVATSCAEDFQEMGANAHLIAAAPELLAVVKSIGTAKFSIWEAIAAIRKAEGSD